MKPNVATNVKGSSKLKTNGFLKLFLGLLFILACVLYSYSMNVDSQINRYVLMAAVFFGAYMALNIGANDVANNMGPAVGSKALTIGWAIVIAAIFELSGAVIAGADVTTTIKRGIVDLEVAEYNEDAFVWIMMAALLAGALWLNLATYVKAPVSTTHAIVGGVAGAGIAGFGFNVILWGNLAQIVVSWVISPIFGGVIAAGLLYFIKKQILHKDDKKRSAKKIVPWLIAFMSFAFTTYLILKGFSNTIKVNFITASFIGILISILVYIISKPFIIKTSDRLPNSRRAVSWLFNIPLIFSAAMLSFAHGANDVSNAIGPLAAIVDIVQNSGGGAEASIPLWVMLVGALGIAVGLMLYGPRLIKTVGNEITELDQIRAFCVAMAAALTVIMASQLGLPVSSTHIAIGGIFGVGFLREWLMQSTLKQEIILVDPTQIHIEEQQKKLEEYKNELESLGKLRKVDPVFIKELITRINEEKKLISHLTAEELGITKIEKKAMKVVQKNEYVKRSALKTILAAWIVTVPVVGLLSAMFYFMIRGIML